MFWIIMSLAASAMLLGYSATVMIRVLTMRFLMGFAVVVPFIFTHAQVQLVEYKFRRVGFL